MSDLFIAAGKLVGDPAISTCVGVNSLVVAVGDCCNGFGIRFRQQAVGVRVIGIGRLERIRIGRIGHLNDAALPVARKVIGIIYRIAVAGTIIAVLLYQPVQRIVTVRHIAVFVQGFINRRPHSIGIKLIAEMADLIGLCVVFVMRHIREPIQRIVRVFRIDAVGQGHGPAIAVFIVRIFGHFRRAERLPGAAVVRIALRYVTENTVILLNM